MNCYCVSDEIQTGRHKLNSEESSPERRKAPFMMKLAHSLGIKDYLINKIVFRKHPSSMLLINIPEYQITQNKQGKFQYSENQFNILKQLENVDTHVSMIQKQNLSVPVLWLKNRTSKSGITIVYSHGNASDMSDSLKFMLRCLRAHGYDAIIYDYTGYGASKCEATNEQTICRDLEAVIQWCDLPHSEILLWGFSLGSFPTVDLASKNKFGGVILHSPIASLANFLDKEGNNSQSIYDIDSLDNIQKISRIKSPINIYHSTHDDIIPFSHSLKLYEQLKASRGSDNNFALIEVQDLGHNQMHPLFISEQKNSLNEILVGFIEGIRKRSLKIKQLWQQDLECQQELIASEHQKVVINNRLSYFTMLS